MSALTIYAEDWSGDPKHYSDSEAIASQLNSVGVRFERWETVVPLQPTATPEGVLAAYQSAIDKLNEEYDFQSVDVVSLTPDHPDKTMFRQKFLPEHTHDDFEVRFFVEGSGLFYLHIAGRVYLVLCEKGDLISVPANTTHWFDMGENPSFTCIRFFTTENGWEGNFTGSDIAGTFPSYDEFVQSLS